MSSERLGWRHPRSPVLIGALTAGLLWAGAAPAFAHEHSQGGTTQGGDAGLPEIVTRIALLLGTATVSGMGLFRGSVTAPTRRAYAVAWVSAALGAGALAISVTSLSVNVPIGLAQLVLTLAMPVLLRWETPALSGGMLLALMLTAESAIGHGGLPFLVDTIFTLSAVAWFGLAAIAFTVPEHSRRAVSYRPGPLALTISTLLALAGVGQLVLSGLGLDRRLYESAYGITLLVLVVVPVVVVVLSVLAHRCADRTGPWRIYRVGVLGVAAAFVAWGALAAIPRPPELPVPGAPLLSSVQLAGSQSNLLLTPQRPGKNLVHLPESLAGAKVGVEGKSATAGPRPGADGSWALIDLPRGRSEVTVDLRGEQATVDADAGERPGGPAEATGPDGPECATAALGAVLGGNKRPITHCPSGTLSATEAASLRSTVRFLADRATPAITLAGDGSPRSVAAQRVVRETAAQERVPVTGQPGKDNALLVVSGWQPAAAKLTGVKFAQAAQQVYGMGVYLAPWLLNGNLVKSTASSLLPLTFDPREPDGLQYALAVQQAFPDDTPTVSGFDNGSSARGRSIGGPTQMYTAAQVNVMQMRTTAPAEDPMGDHMHGSYEGQWLPGGTIIPATAQLR
jgi:hypothetical protein